MEATSSSGSFYEIIEGAIYNKELLAHAAAFATDGPIGVDAAKDLWKRTTAYTGDDAGVSQISEVDLRTIDYITKHMSCDVVASLFLTEAMKAEAKSKPALGMSPAKRKSLAAGSPRGKATPGGSAEKDFDPYAEIQRIEDEISKAKTPSRVEKLQHSLEKLLARAQKNADAEAQKNADNEAQAAAEASQVDRAEPPVAMDAESEQEHTGSREVRKKPAAQEHAALKRPAAPDKSRDVRKKPASQVQKKPASTARMAASAVKRKPAKR
mmetsp:Transcript_50869/g.143200  ORF Transcript_50869/g.143200 Transcript_50869/m.143200 type:complete len:268 (-) Transcript_50869:63-866(-)